VQAEQVRDVAVLVVRVVLVFEPFLELFVLSDLIGRDTAAQLGQLSAKVWVHAERFGGFDAVGEQITDNLMVHRRTGDESAVFRRVGRRAYQPAGLWVLDEKIDEKHRRPFHYGVRLLFEKHFIAAEQVMLP